MPIKIPVTWQQRVERPLYCSDPGRVHVEPAPEPTCVRSSVRLKNIELPTDARVVNDFKFRITHNLSRRFRKCHTGFRSRNRVTFHSRRHRIAAEPLAYYMQLVTELGHGPDKLRTPLGHPAAARIKFVDDKADSHQAARFHERWSISFALR